VHDELLHIGLTRVEAAVYSCLIDLGKAQAGTLSRKTGVHRRSVYDALERLIEKGLVSFIKENDERHYLPADPVRIKQLIDDKRDAIYRVLPALEAAYGEQKQKQETLFYRGLEGIKTIFEDQIAEGKTVHILGAAKNASDIMRFYMPHYTNKRVKKKIKLIAIYAGERRAHPIPYADVRYLPETYASPVSTNIYGDKVAIILWSHEPVAILIKNKEIAETYLKYFQLMHTLAKV
jgi:sugar-specific transcriptional regulator TrmB